MASKKPHMENSQPTEEAPLSVCDIMQTRANGVIGKLESLMPANMQMYSDFYAELLNSLQDIFGACNIAENEILSRMGINQNTIQAFSANTKAFTKSASIQIEIANNLQTTFLLSQISAMKVFDQYDHLMLDSYAKTLAATLSYLKKQ